MENIYLVAADLYRLSVQILDRCLHRFQMIFLHTDIKIRRHSAAFNVKINGKMNVIASGKDKLVAY